MACLIIVFIYITIFYVSSAESEDNMHFYKVSSDETEETPIHRLSPIRLQELRVIDERTRYSEDNMRFYKNLVSSNDTEEAPIPRISPIQLKELRVIDEKLSKCGKYSVDIRELTVEKAQSLFASRRLTVAELTLCYLRRIQEMNPTLKAVTQVNQKAILDAIQADKDLSLNLNRELYGIPVLIKDNIAVAGMENTAGSPALLGLKPISDARVVKKLRKAGVIILGKTNLSEFAYFRGTGIPSGWSGVGGQTVCPYNASLNPSGSSSGSAVAVAANLALLALGTETDGSIASPSSKQSLVGLKPTSHVVPTDGVIPISFSQDNVGPIARTAKDAEIVFDCTVEKKVQSRKFVSYEHRLKVGVLREYFWDYSQDKVLESQKDALETALKRLSSSDLITLVDPVKPHPELLKDVSVDKESIVLLHEFKYGINKYLMTEVVRDHQTKESVSSLADIIKYNIEHGLVVPFNQKTLELSENTDGIHNKTYLSALKDNKKGVSAYLDQLMDHYGLDMIVGPADPDLNLAHVCSLAAISGYPSLTVPAGFRPDGSPVGLTFIGKPYTEKILFSVGELMDSNRKPPKFL